MIRAHARKILRRLFHHAGYRRLPVQRQDLKQCKLTSGKVIEFIGPSGVGKSFLCDRAFPLLSAHWRKGISPPKSSEDHLMPEMSAHWKLLRSKFEKLSLGQLNSYQRAKLLRYFSEVIAKDLEMRAQLSMCGFVLDEGLFHNFGKELLALDDDEFGLVAASRIIIALLPSRPETVVERRRSRFDQKGFLVTSQSGKSRDEQLKAIESSVNTYQAVMDRATHYRVPWLRLTAEASLGDNLTSILEFEKVMVGAQA